MKSTDSVCHKLPVAKIPIMSLVAEQLIDQIKVLPPEDLREVCEKVVCLVNQRERHVSTDSGVIDKNGDTAFFDALEEIRALGRLPTLQRPVGF